jgi:hypothetical protein
LARSRLIAFLQEIPMSRLPTSGEWREGSLGRTTADWPFDWVAEITAIDPLTHSYTCIGTVRQAGTRRYDEALTNLRLMTRAPAMLRILRAVAQVLDMSDPDHEAFVDSARIASTHCFCSRRRCGRCRELVWQCQVPVPANAQIGNGGQTLRQ